MSMERAKSNLIQTVSIDVVGLPSDDTPDILWLTDGPWGERAGIIADEDFAMTIMDHMAQAQEADRVMRCIMKHVQEGRR